MSLASNCALSHNLQETLMGFRVVEKYCEQFFGNVQVFIFCSVITQLLDNVCLKINDGQYFCLIILLVIYVTITVCKINVSLLK